MRRLAREPSLSQVSKWTTPECRRACARLVRRPCVFGLLCRQAIPCGRIGRRRGKAAMKLPDFLIDHPDGEIRVTGSRIGLYHIIADYKDGQTPQMLHEQFPHLPLDVIQRVIAFYHDNQAEVDAYV